MQPNPAARVALLALAACGAAPVPAPPSARAPHPADPVDAADAAMRNDMPIDYELPFADRHERREHRVHAAVVACQAGDKRSCWRAMQMAAVEQQPALAKTVELNCLAGDVLSCRALPVSPDERYPHAPGAAGRSAACEQGDAACDRSGLRAECSAGFPRSCLALASIRPAEPHPPGSLSARIDSLTTAGCEAWILAECGSFTLEPAEQIRRETRQCELIGSCNSAGIRAYNAGNYVAARDAYERSCQYDERDSHRCLGLAEAYLDHRFAEPVPGRGQALLDWECVKWEKLLDKGESILDMLPQCSRMTPHK